ncbi:MAG: EAL domain-containing protein [Thiobacillus sp.]|nr:EAL domain-containing protein [Thiobacillus sp.]
MSLYRQLWASILVSMLIALAASLFAVLFNGRIYLEKQLSIKNRDNAAALALAMGQQDLGADGLVVAVTAQFNSGQYEYIQINDPQGRSIVERIAPGADPEVPRWFIRLLPIRPAPGVAQISSGWQQVGSIVLMSQSRFAYRDLWDGALSLCGVMLAAGLLGGGLGTLVLRRIRKPMRAVIDQANAISQRRFATIPEPEVPELRQLASAMNDMVTRLGQEFQEDAARFETLRRQANFDPLTGLANRSFFMANLTKALTSEDSPGGSLAIIRVARLEHINRQFGREAADALLVRISQTLGAMGAACPGIFAARLKGADFALMLTAECDTRSVLETLQDKLGELAEPYADRVASSYIGFGAYYPGELQSDLLARVDQAVAEAESEGHDAVREAPPCCQAPTPTNTEDWRQALRHVLTHPDHLKLVQQPISLEGNPQCECHLRIRLAGEGDWLPAYRFMPQAERIGLAPDLDLAAISLALDRLEAGQDGKASWINLSSRSMADSSFRDRLLEALMSRHELLDRLWLDVHEIGAIRRLDGLREMARMLKPLGCRLGLSHYGHQFSRIGDLYGLGLDFLKVDACFIRDIQASPGNQAFLAGLRDTAHKIGMKVLAEGVESQAELDKLVELGLDGLTGPVLGEKA